MDDDHSMHGGHAQHVAMDHGHAHGDDDQSVGAKNHNGMHHDGKSIPNYWEINTEQLFRHDEDVFPRWL